MAVFTPGCERLEKESQADTVSVLVPVLPVTVCCVTSKESLTVSESLPVCAGRGLDRIFWVASNSNSTGLEAWAVPGSTPGGARVERGGRRREESSEGLGTEGHAIKKRKCQLPWVHPRETTQALEAICGWWTGPSVPGHPTEVTGREEYPSNADIECQPPQPWPSVASAFSLPNPHAGVCPSTPPGRTDDAAPPHRGPPWSPAHTGPPPGRVGAHLTCHKQPGPTQRCLLNKYRSRGKFLFLSSRGSFSPEAAPSAPNPTPHALGP